MVCFVYVSSMDMHRSIMVLAVLKLFFLHDFAEFRDQELVTRVHYEIDGPTSQYRNRCVFWLLVNHNRVFGMPCLWHFLSMLAISDAPTLPVTTNAPTNTEGVGK